MHACMHDQSIYIGSHQPRKKVHIQPIDVDCLKLRSNSIDHPATRHSPEASADPEVAAVAAAAAEAGATGARASGHTRRVPLSTNVG